MLSIISAEDKWDIKTERPKIFLTDNDNRKKYSLSIDSRENGINVTPRKTKVISTKKKTSFKRFDYFS